MHRVKVNLSQLAPLKMANARFVALPKLCAESQGVTKMERNVEKGATAPRREPADFAAGGLAMIMDELAHGVLVASATGQLLHANQAARHELARRQALSVHEGRLHTTDTRQSRLLVNALEKADNGL